MQRERGIAIIIAYKFVKGGLGLAAGIVLLTCAVLGIHGPFLGLVAHLRHHTGVWSLQLAKLVVRATTRRGLWIATVALLGDATFTLVEGWALVHGRWWGPWLVVVATASFVPFEIISLSRHLDVIRACVLAVNACIVAYLFRKAMRERRRARDLVNEPPQGDFHRPRQTQ